MATQERAPTLSPPEGVSNRDVHRWRPLLSTRGALMGMAALAISLCAPVGLWGIWHVLGPRASLEEIRVATLVYVTLSTAGVFWAFGVLAGRLLDEVETARARLALDAREDALTGLANRRSFNERLQQEMARQARSGEALALIMLDVDRFKDINDVYGHQAGDKVLWEVANQIRGSCRAVDIPARYGGEEFAVIMPGLGAEAARQVAERIRGDVERAVTAFAGKSLRVTVSAGVATTDRLHDNQPDGDVLVERSDACLLRAKRQGRNTVCSMDGGESDTAAASPTRR